tara:strand:+ start:74 stop:1594 length:1521 start_codon:yes stop_codon:yes gene_type:complete
MSSLNDLTNYNTPLQQNAIDIRTEYIEPITSSAHRHTFRLDQTGYLDTNSMLVFKLQSVGAVNDGTCRVNQWNGALGGIKRVIFQIGDNIINDIQDVYKYSTLKNMNMPPSMRNNFLGHYLGNSLWLDVQKNGQTGSADKFQTDPNALQTYFQEYTGTTGSIVPNYKKSGTDFGKYDDGAGSAINSSNIFNDKAKNNQYGIPLGMLIPALKGQKIPLFLFEKQRILLTFEFNSAEIYCNNIKASKLAYTGAGNGVCDAGDVVPVDVQMVVDYLVMPTDVQNELVQKTQQQGGYKLEFYDVVNVEKNIVAGTQGQEQLVEHRIGQNNREVHNIIMWKDVALDTMINFADTKRGIPLMGKQGCRGFAREEYNCNIDGRDEFDHFLFNPVSQYNEMSAVLGKDLQVSRPHYINDENSVSAQLTPRSAGIQGTMKPLGLSLRNGEPLVVGGGRQIGNYPIVWKWKRTSNSTRFQQQPVDDYAIKCNYFCEVSRVANIMATDKGMNVVVSY